MLFPSHFFFARLLMCGDRFLHNDHLLLSHRTRPSHTLEHKNMPLDDALGLIDRDYERYSQNVRDGRLPPRRGPANKEDVSQLLSRAASGDSLSQDQLSAVISALQKKQEHKSPTAQPASGSGRPSEPGERLGGRRPAVVCLCVA